MHCFTGCTLYRSVVEKVIHINAIMRIYVTFGFAGINYYFPILDFLGRFSNKVQLKIIILFYFSLEDVKNEQLVPSTATYSSFPKGVTSLEVLEATPRKTSITVPSSTAWMWLEKHKNAVLLMVVPPIVCSKWFARLRLIFKAMAKREKFFSDF